MPVYEQIRQIIPSPNGSFLAIVTDHTVHISVLPDSPHLSSSDNAPIRVKTYQLGPTTHVIPESPVVSALWHPLGLHSNTGGCLVTITADAAVRVWELDRNNHWSFDRPTLAVDLRKLVDGTSSDQDFTPSGFGKNKGFSADTYDMEVASACFGGSGAEGEDAWAPMTLWIAMRPGDLYALCPLLPSRWQAPPATIPSLSATIIPKLSALESDPVDYEDDLTACRQQYDWLKEIDSQEPLQTPLSSDVIPGSEIFMRPANPSAIARLQGPFRFDTGDEMDDLDICDILVLAAKEDNDELMMGEDEELATDDEDKLSATVICLSNGNGRIHICLELDGVEGQWLPKGRKNLFTRPLSEPSDLVLAESLDTVREGRQQEGAWPTFTKDVHSRYNFFLTTARNVTFFSLSSWAQRLEAELQSEDISGSAFRLNILCEGSMSQREPILEVDENDVVLAGKPGHLAPCLVYYDYDLGYLLLTNYASYPYAALMDVPEGFAPSVTEPSASVAQASALPAFPPRRPPYQAPSIFYAKNPLDAFVDKNVPHRHRNTLKEHVRLSPATLDLVTAAHRIMSAHTNAVERAASDLFRRCERLQGEMRDQLKQMSDVSERIRDVSNEVSEDGQRKEGSRGTALDKRIQDARDKQGHLAQRYESLRNKLMKSGGRPLSEKERSWVTEVQTLSDSFEDMKQEGDDRDQNLPRRLERVGPLARTLGTRVITITQAKELATDLVSEAKSVTAKTPTPAEPTSPTQPPGAQPKVPQKLQRAKVGEAMKMVERE